MRVCDAIGMMKRLIVKQHKEEKMKKVQEETLGEIYCELMPHIEHDSWTNYRNYLQEGFTNGWIKDDFRRSFHADLRRTILRENKEELLGLLNQDLVERVKSLELQLNRKYDNYF